MKSLLEYQPEDDKESARIRSVADDALHYGRDRAPLPYWKSVHAFTERYGRDMQTILHLPTAQVLVVDFQRRFYEVLMLTQRLETTEPIEQFDVEFRRYLAEIAHMMHEYKQLASQKRCTEVTLEEARSEAHTAIIARAWDPDHNLTMIKQGTTLPYVQDDGSAEGRSKPVILELGKFRVETNGVGKHGGMRSLLRAS
ncbi:hypothetical protein COU78_04135 [Candidatus Peregrinibacteria bacterium CG10_big_fil_rev_8_21_14_0_10_49_24]|nr:MAG: hypothetical protein COV83_00665 [Candidatus Peregrinibacteria bacterium CG11_big_fil_rev_8_21_14_0_20_49_14]PIR50858.1 MAG: hypothetical protein COU78_04135 [Candidatus Peregrinibacteria bacterium CG10_big_fil_rev_8_21_14_0_10_49_24]PJA67135.1 MAG: hypothetical protein CO157_06065 [Candidatus Peregrinibacteria bacterium CG_4_9_14_3_um_filter_49_12]